MNHGSSRWHTADAKPVPIFSFSILFLISLFSYVDRSLISILQVPIKQDLGLSHAQLGALTGLAFAIVYATVGIPIARLADRSNRKRLIAFALLTWSLMTAFTGLATSYALLVIFRMGLALGESACGPATISILSDLFPRQKRATAIALVGMAFPLGTMLGMGAAGWFGEAQGWRSVFIGAGLVGLVLVPLTLIMQEPRRGQSEGQYVILQHNMSFRDALSSIWQSRATLWLLVGSAFHSFTFCAISIWSAPFYSRVFAMDLSTVGLLMGAVFGLIGGLAAIVSGWLADRLTRRNVSWYGWLPAIGALGVVPAGLCQFLVPSAALSIAFATVTAGLLHIYMSPMSAALQSLAHPQCRAFVAALVGFLGGTVGYGLGPLITGLLSDGFVRKGFESDALRFALAIVLSGSLIAGIAFLRASRHLRDELD